MHAMHEYDQTQLKKTRVTRMYFVVWLWSIIMDARLSSVWVSEEEGFTTMHAVHKGMCCICLFRMLALKYQCDTFHVVVFFYMLYVMLFAQQTFSLYLL